MAKPKNDDKPRLIDINGLVTIIEPKDGKTFTLGEMYDLIGTDMVESKVIKGKRILMMDEEGKRKNKPVNSKATALLMEAGKIQAGDFVVGKVIVAPSKYFR